MSQRLNKQFAGNGIIKGNAGILFASGTTVPSDTTAGYAPGCIFIHEDGTSGQVAYVNDGSVTSSAFNAISTTGADQTLEDEVDLGFGAPDVTMRWDTSDANANKLLIQVPAGDATNVPAIVIGPAIADVDMALHNGIVSPLVSIIGTGATATGPVLESRKARGTATAPTVVTSGDDVFSLRGYACVAAGEWVQTAEIRFDCAGTVATTRGPGTITFQTATDAAPSVLTTAMTISAAQLVTVAAGLTVTTGTVTISSGDLTVTSGDINFTAASDLDIAANTAAALEVDDGTTKLVVIDSRNTVKNVNGVLITSPATTIASEGAAHENPSLKLAAKTITYTGTTGTTSQLGAMLNVGALTITDADMMTLTTASAVHINALAAAGGMLTISNSYMISTSVSDAYLTNAGVWTDTMCWARDKEQIEDADASLVDRVLDRIKPRSWKYRDDGAHGQDFGRERVGIVYDELPDELLAAGQEKAVAAGGLASFALAAIKVLADRVKELEAKLA